MTHHHGRGCYRNLGQRFHSDGRALSYPIVDALDLVFQRPSKKEPHISPCYGSQESWLELLLCTTEASPPTLAPLPPYCCCNLFGARK